MEDKRLFLLDAYALIYRAYYALLRSPRTNSAGLNTSAIYGFVNTLSEVLRKENPGYIAVCFDPPHGHTFRHDEYPEYKAGRDKQPEDITLAIPYIKAILEAYCIPVIEVDGYEADDVIGTLARRAADQGFTTYMMTLDKDYGQLVDEHIFMYRPSIKGQGFEVRGPEEICSRYGIAHPRQVIDLLALEGDASDNVPGCPGVGEKTAARLIAEFGSVDALLANTDKIKGALQRKIIDNADLIRMSRRLVTIVTDVPVEIEPEALRRCEPNIEALKKIYTQLEFKSFLQKLAPEPKAVVEPVADDLFAFADAQEAEAPAAEVHAGVLDARELTQADDIAHFVGSLSGKKYVGMAVNADGNEAMTATPLGVALAVASDADEHYEAAYIPFPGDAAARSGIAMLLKPLLTDNTLTVCSADIKRDMLILSRIGAAFEGVGYFDTSVAHYLCNPEQKHDLPTIAMTYLGVKTHDYNLPPAQRHMPPLDPVDAMCAKAMYCLQLQPILEKEVEHNGQTDLMRKLEFPLIAVLASMEREGARIDPQELKRLSKELTARLLKLEEEAYAIVGRPFNISSPAQVGNILFGEMQIDPKAKRTKGGSWSTAEDILEKYASTVPLVKLILDIRGLRKLLATYVDALPKLINPATGKLHTTYNQTVTATGRLSSTNPNLQNIPIRSTDGRDIRRAFIADPGDLLLSADYSQIELRLMADLSGDQTMIEAFAEGEDFHRATAAKIYHLAPEDVTDNLRRNAKTANFGIIYGISAFGLSERLGIPRGEAKELIDNYLSTYSGVARYMQHSIEQARKDGYVVTILGRRRYLPDINSRSNTVRSYAERNAINAPLQGSAADIIKIAMVRIDAEIRRRGLASRMIMQVHDELIFNVRPDELSQVQQLVVETMENAYKGSVPLEVSAGVAVNWLDAH